MSFLGTIGYWLPHGANLSDRLVLKIVSDGQTDSDRTALELAIVNRRPHSGANRIAAEMKACQSTHGEIAFFFKVSVPVRVGRYTIAPYFFLSTLGYRSRSRLGC